MKTIELALAIGYTIESVNGTTVISAGPGSFGTTVFSEDIAEIESALKRLLNN